MMNFFRKRLPLATLTAIMVSFACLADVAYVAAAGPKISELASGNTKGNKHNLSAVARQFGTTTYVANINTYQATDDPVGNRRGQQICIFCHTPHSANVVGQAPLWNRKFSVETAFQRYSSGTLQIRKIVNAQYASDAQPNGSSKLCLSCHDGVSKLGALYPGPLATTGPEIIMKTTGGGSDYITGIASFKPDTNKMKSGHHPVSFVYNASVLASIIASDLPGKIDYKLSTLPLYVKVDKQSRMQCTTCHDPHQNQSDDTKCYVGMSAVETTCDATDTRKVAPFWVYGLNGTAGGDQEAVCLSCHPLNAGAGFVRPW